jgi:hypothetical protein
MLIAYICVAEACMSYNAIIQVVNPVEWICYFGMEKVFAVTATWGQYMQNEVNSLQCAANTLC